MDTNRNRTETVKHPIDRKRCFVFFKGQHLRVEKLLEKENVCILVFLLTGNVTLSKILNFLQVPNFSNMYSDENAIR